MTFNAIFFPPTVSIARFARHGTLWPMETGVTLHYPNRA